MTTSFPLPTSASLVNAPIEVPSPHAPKNNDAAIVDDARAEAMGKIHNGALLRLLTCGSVDDGKSTLIGRLLYDSRALFADQLAAVESASKRRGDEKIDLSLFTDGLRWEREQGITIDVAYRYFSTATRRFILIDSPGHIQYTRNMVTGASHADVAVLLVDARHGVQEQTHRHAYLVTLVGIRHLIVAVNKMDLVGHAQSAFDSVRDAFERFRAELAPDGRTEITYIPISALNGDNVVTRSEHTPWYTGPGLLEKLESIEPHAKDHTLPARFPVQWIIRPRGKSAEHHDYRGFAGQVASGTFRVGDRIVALSSGRTSTIASIRLFDRELTHCTPPQSVAIALQDDLDIGRGDILALADEQPAASETQSFAATLVWLGNTPMKVGKRYLVRHGTLTAPALLSALESRLDIATLQRIPAATETGNVPASAQSPAAPAVTLNANDIGTVRLRCASPLFVDPYHRCRATGSFILVDEATNETAAAGIIDI